jgi:putative toxin-antitoxin system antitoxin component (TIGR02293 family)
MATTTDRKSAAATKAAPAKPAPSGPLPTLRIVPNTSSPAAVIALIDQARVGFAASSLCELGQRLELPVRELETLLGTTERTLTRRFNINDKLTKADLERLLLLQRLVVHCVDMFEYQGEFNRWLRLPLPLLDGQSPLQLLDMTSGFQVVNELLGRIEYGV